MSDHPMLFSAPMVRALLAGTKTQTRRVLKPQPGDDGLYHDLKSAYRALRIAPGDRLWVRENGLEALGTPLFKLFAHDATPGRYWTDSDGGRYGASYSKAITRQSMINSGRWKIRPCIHMPRWASRLTLLVTERRVQRLQDISEEDAKAEGLTPRQDGWFAVVDERRGLTGAAPDARVAYALLWNIINGAGSWDANPWCVAYTFAIVDGER